MPSVERVERVSRVRREMGMRRRRVSDRQRAIFFFFSFAVSADAKASWPVI